MAAGKAGSTALSNTVKTALFSAATHNAGIAPTTAKVKNANASAGNVSVYVNGELADILEAGDVGHYRPAGGVVSLEVQAASTATVIHSAGVVQL